MHLLYYGYDHELPFEDNDQNEIDLSDRLISRTISKSWPFNYLIFYIKRDGKYFVFKLLKLQLLISFVAAAPGKSNSFSLTRTTTTQKSQPAVDLRQPSEIFSRSKKKYRIFIYLLL